MDVLLGPAHLGDVDQPLHARLQLHERAVVGDVGDRALEACADRILGLDAGPGIGLQLLHAEADALGLGIDAHDLHLDRIADVDDLARVIDAAPGHVGDVQQAVDAAQVDEGAVVGDVLDQAFDHLTLGQLRDDLGALLGARGFQDLAARDDDVAAPAIHLQDLEGLRRMHQRADVAHRPHVDLAAGQEGHGAIEVDGEAALDLVEDDAFDLLLVVELLLQPGPALLAARLLARQHGLAQRVLHALEIDLDGVADLQLGRLAGHGRIRAAGTRPSIFRPTSMTARSFSMAVTVPLTTLPSKASSSERVSFSRAAKSSRVGFKSFDSMIGDAHSCSCRPCLRSRVSLAGSERQTGNAASACSARRVPSSCSWCRFLPADRAGQLGLEPTLQVRPRWPTFLRNHADGRLECGFYIQIAGIQQDRRRRPAAWGRHPGPRRARRGGGCRPGRAAYVDGLAPARHLQVAPPGPDLGAGGDENLNVGVGAHDGADVPAVEHGARLAGGEGALERQAMRRAPAGMRATIEAASPAPGPAQGRVVEAGASSLRAAAAATLRPPGCPRAGARRVPRHGRAGPCRGGAGRNARRSAWPACPCRTRPARRWR